MSSPPPWVYLATAPNQLTAEMWVTLLQGEGLPVLVRSGDTASYLGLSMAPCRLLVRADRLEEARRALAQHTGRQPSDS